jgi:hypothetical protein
MIRSGLDWPVDVRPQLGRQPRVQYTRPCRCEKRSMQVPNEARRRPGCVHKHRSNAEGYPSRRRGDRKGENNGQKFLAQDGGTRVALVDGLSSTPRRTTAKAPEGSGLQRAALLFVIESIKLSLATCA